MRTLSRYGLVLFSAFLLATAFSVYSMRRAGAQHARQLLDRTYRADNTLTYSAISTVTAMYGNHEMASTARVLRAPGKLSITYIGGDRKGQQSGYNGHWFWRRDGEGAPIQAYAQVKLNPDTMAASRFQLMMQNYRAFVIENDQVNGRNAELVELDPRPENLVDGAQGPFKRLWIDRDTGLTLRSDSFNYQRQLVMNTIVSKLDLHPNFDSSAFASPDTMRRSARLSGWTTKEMGKAMGTDKRGVESETGMRVPMPAYLPPGFVLDGVGIHHCSYGAGSPKAALARFTDGLNTLTVFALRLPARPAAGTHGATHAHKPTGDNDAAGHGCDFGMGNIVMIEKKGVQGIAVADLPPATLHRVLDATEFARAGNSQ